MTWVQEERGNTPHWVSFGNQAVWSEPKALCGTMLILFRHTPPLLLARLESVACKRCLKLAKEVLK